MLVNVIAFASKKRIKPIHVLRCKGRAGLVHSQNSAGLRKSFELYIRVEDTGAWPARLCESAERQTASCTPRPVMFDRERAGERASRAGNLTATTRSEGMTLHATFSTGLIAFCLTFTACVVLLEASINFIHVIAVRKSYCPISELALRLGKTEVLGLHTLFTLHAFSLCILHDLYQCRLFSEWCLVYSNCMHWQHLNDLNTGNHWTGRATELLRTFCGREISHNAEKWTQILQPLSLTEPPGHALRFEVLLAVFFLCLPIVFRSPGPPAVRDYKHRDSCKKQSQVFRHFETHCGELYKPASAVINLPVTLFELLRMV